MSEGSRVRRTADEPDIGAGLPIQTVSRLLEIPAPTIRSWERRYGIPITPRSNGGHRRYQADELSALRLMRDEIARGRRAADAAAIVRAGAPTAGGEYRPLIDAFLAAAHDLDAAGVRAVLEHADERLGVDEAITEVLLPGMRMIGLWWQSGRCDVAHEHLATEASRAWMNKLLYLGPAPSQPETVLLTCGPRDFHTLGLEAMGVLLAHRGFGCRLLGARTPVRSVTLAVAGTDAAAVVMVSHLSSARRSAVEAMVAAHQTGAQVFYGGNAFISPRSRNGVPGVYLGENLTAAAETMTATLVAARERRNSVPAPPDS